MDSARKLLLAATIVILLGIAYWGWTMYSRPVYIVVTEKPIFGNPQAKVTVMEFGDLQCPACKDAHPTITRIKAQYRENISYKFMQYPLSFHNYAQKAAEAVECANDFGKFFDYIDAAYIISPDLQRENLINEAVKLGIPRSNFTACLDSDFKANFIAMDMREGDRLGLQGTPTFYINGKKAPERDFNTLSSMIDSELKKTN